MNEKAIAEVRNELRRGWLIEGLDPAFLPRLLDEREALLGALKELLARVPLTDEELGARVRLARAAIAKAEAE